jgi:hypothetical protein
MKDSKFLNIDGPMLNPDQVVYVNPRQGAYGEIIELEIFTTAPTLPTLQLFDEKAEAVYHWWRTLYSIDLSASVRQFRARIHDDLENQQFEHPENFPDTWVAPALTIGQDRPERLTEAGYMVYLQLHHLACHLGDVQIIETDCVDSTFTVTLEFDDDSIITCPASHGARILARWPDLVEALAGPPETGTIADRILEAMPPEP